MSGNVGSRNRLFIYVWPCVRRSVDCHLWSWFPFTFVLWNLIRGGRDRTYALFPSCRTNNFMRISSWSLPAHIYFHVINASRQIFLLGGGETNGPPNIFYFNIGFFSLFVCVQTQNNLPNNKYVTDILFIFRIYLVITIAFIVDRCLY